MTALLSSSNLDINISDEDLAQLLTQLPQENPDLGENITEQHFLPWDCIASEKDMPEQFYMVLDGLVQIVISSKEGRRLVTSVLGPGAVFGEESIITFAVDGPDYCAQALKPSKIWKIPASEAKELLIQHPAIRLALLRTFERRLVQVENRLEETAYLWLPERLAAEILRQSQYAGSNQIRLSHQVLADILGTYRETISAILRDFREAGWVKLGYRRITILDKAALERMAGIRDKNRMLG